MWTIAKVAGASHSLNATAATLLGFLQFGHASGYQLAGRIERSVGNFWSVTRSQIYRELRWLEDAGYVEVAGTGSRQRRDYRLTERGRAAFEAWLATGPPPELIRDSLLLFVFFADTASPEARLRVVREAQATHTARLAAYRALLPEVEPLAPTPALTLHFGIMYEELVLRWLDNLPWSQRPAANDAADEQPATSTPTVTERSAR
jgi:DNA-binding PadR family transcriptional regulator